MFKNLRSEMVRHDINIDGLAEILGITRQAASNKLNGKRPFSLPEAEAIRDFFKSKGKDYTIEYLFFTPSVPNSEL
ncbi:MAG TPA: helix-turn-helix transcriptional regulator [Methanosarcinales archaeon]|nr:helix-turn-helix transcriptional regulator [Methanosarcinales archaeon]